MLSFIKLLLTPSVSRNKLDLGRPSTTYLLLQGHWSKNVTGTRTYFWLFSILELLSARFQTKLWTILVKGMKKSENNKANLIFYLICNNIVGHWNIGKTTKLHIYKGLYLLTLTFPSESWILFDKHQPNHGSRSEISDSGW